MLPPRPRPFPVLPCAAACLATLVACDAHVPAPGTPALDKPVVAAPEMSAPGGEPTVSAAAAAPKPPRYQPPAPPDPPIVLAGGGKRAVKGAHGAVTSVEANATRVGIEVLGKGGNAVDAAVAVAYVLAVTHPSAGNIGGGGFMMVRLASGEVHAIDFRETAPKTVTTERVLAMLDKDGAIGWRSAGVPGTVAGLGMARDRFGSRPLAELVQPAIDLARKGHKLGARQGLALGWSWPKLSGDAAARAIFGRGKKALARGERIEQKDLAGTLETIARQGERAFYEGPIAQKIDEAMRNNGGYMTAEDLRAYRPKLRTPLRFAYRGFTVDSMPPPSMGGVALAGIMLTLERVRAHDAPLDSGMALHFFVESARRAYAERRLVGGDPDFLPPETHNPLLTRLLDGGYLAARQPPIERDKATPSAALSQVAEKHTESPETTHFSVVDAAGNAVACTVTQSAGYGAKVVVPGTGVLLGNALGGFSEAGVNTVAPGKRMASSMSPTIVTQSGKLALVLGSPGGDTIPNTVAQVLRNLVDYRQTIDLAVTHPRIHHQWMPDKVRVEKQNAPPKSALDDLVRRGHVLDMDATPIGDANDILVEANGVAWAAADGREGGKAMGLDMAPAKPPGAPGSAPAAAGTEPQAPVPAASGGAK
jgi:gamma-glutamyltranspeptidase/glutathione hydrolase